MPQSSRNNAKTGRPDPPPLSALSLFSALSALIRPTAPRSSSGTDVPSGCLARGLARGRQAPPNPSRASTPPQI
ncbi:hypothetical protein Sgou_29980 [Streptomyces gougerotii]|uniref:Uncharacterized protein n=2 Tax=Streptomyces diastaticus group TaxID=2849069 RepID=A0A8H9HKX4_9ACTN|nr:hypothetical protein Sdia_04410 [Streptomyces diastaticus subsp. diastaticus]GFH78328.1 hypothetical protein Sgou_29980 [Streptomyces gougerotii]GGU18806.1 hypothetical protein GCM10015534_22000 [Streptomyces diastaticus subsp. diastaticus]GGU70131.1 hypothetical protein GCM10010227_25200 [Streptomyces gougerotii]